MNEANHESRAEAIHSLRELLSTQTEFKGIEGATNGIICFDNDRTAFVEKNSRKIAAAALQQGVSSSAYSYIGIEGIHTAELKEHLQTIPSHDTVYNNMRFEKTFLDGARDYLTINRESNVVSYSWMPSKDSTGSRRIYRNVLVAKFSNEGIERLTELAKIAEPGEIYRLLLASLYPNALIPLSDEEIIATVKKEGKDLIHMIQERNPEMADKFRKGVKNPKALVDFVNSHSVLERKKPCEEVNVTIV